MSAEFTGERVIPGQVDIDLWNEHISRYAFAQGLANGGRVLDAGCGSGYGSAELARTANTVIGVDVSLDALHDARTQYQRGNLRWAQASCTSIPFSRDSFDLVVAFEVIEHLPDWQQLLNEARRVLRSTGLFVVSTPNKAFYAEARGASGPNPFHVHEFEFEEFRNALTEVFPYVSLFAQDHAEGIVFRKLDKSSGADAAIDDANAPPEHANFFVAVCAADPQVDPSSFVYIPRGANILRERALHIERLSGELVLKDAWLKSAQDEHKKLVEAYRNQKLELERGNEWARQLDEKLRGTAERVVQLQDELDQQQLAALEVANAYEQKLAEANAELERRTEWAQQIERDLKSQTSELYKAVQLLDEAEITIQERTQWAQGLERERTALASMVSAAQSSKWVRLGRLVGIGPDLHRPE